MKQQKDQKIRKGRDVFFTLLAFLIF